MKTKTWDELTDDLNCKCDINGKLGDGTKITDEANENKFCKEDCNDGQYWNSAANNGAGECQEG